MKQDTISHTQLTALVWAGVLAPAAELLPALTLPGAGKGAWLAPAAAAPLVLLGGWLLGALSGEEGLARRLRAGLGPVAGRGVLLLYILWAQLLLGVRLRMCAQRLLDSGYRDGALWFFLLTIAGLSLWIGQGKLSAFARAGQVFLAILLCTAGAVLVLSLPQTRPERVLPLWTGDALPVLRSALPCAGVLGWGSFGAFLAGSAVQPGKKRAWHWLFWGLGGCVLLTLSQLVVLGNLGPALAARLDNPFFALAKSVGVEGAFQRVESVIAALWVCSDLTMAAVLLFSLRAMVEQTIEKAPPKAVSAAAALVGTVLALAFFSGGRAARWNREIVPAVNLAMGLGLPLLLWLWLRLCGKGRRGGTSCG